VLLVQAIPFNAIRVATVIVAIVTLSLALAQAPGNVQIGKSEAALGSEQVAVACGGSRPALHDTALIAPCVLGGARAS